MAHHPTSSRVLDAIFESPTVPQRTRNKFILKFVGHFHELVDDKFGSRVGDRMWAGSDPYLKVNRGRDSSLNADYHHTLGEDREIAPTSRAEFGWVTVWKVLRTKYEPAVVEEGS